MRGDQCWWDWAGIPSWFVAEYNSKYESAALLGRVAGRIAKWQTRATKLASAALEYGVARLPIVICPGCKKAMPPSKSKPILFSNGLEGVAYTLKRCAVSTLRHWAVRLGTFAACFGSPSHRVHLTSR